MTMQTFAQAIVALLSGRSSGILTEISDATGVSVLSLSRMNRHEIVQAIRDAGIPLSTVPPHIVHALGLVHAD